MARKVSNNDLHKTSETTPFKVLSPQVWLPPGNRLLSNFRDPVRQLSLDCEPRHPRLHQLEFRRAHDR
jgi:hypothetical protein